MIALFKNATFLLIACLSLTVSTAGLALNTVSLGAKVTAMTASATAAAVAHRKEIAAAVARGKAKARLRRAIAVIPFVGLGAAAIFEEQDFAEWKTDHPEGTFADYTCENAALSIELVDDVLQGLPEKVRPNSSLVLAALPKCETDPPASE